LTPISFVIAGEPASKANSRKIVTLRGRPSSIKSKKARSYEASAMLQIPMEARAMLTGPVRVTLRIFYASELPDLDESVVLDVLQAKVEIHRDDNGKEIKREVIRRGVYVNDRQVREKHVFHRIDRKRPRAEVTVEPLEAQQPDLLGDPAAEVQGFRSLQLGQEISAQMDEHGDDVVRAAVLRVHQQRADNGLTFTPDTEGAPRARRTKA
jgi:hypothetical protein